MTVSSSQQTLVLAPSGGAERRFVVARNPDPESSLSYLLQVPVGGGMLLKAREPWPLSSRVYCHAVSEEEVALGSLEVLEEVAVRMCGWRGRAIDLVLDRNRHNRSRSCSRRRAGGRRSSGRRRSWRAPRAPGCGCRAGRCRRRAAW